MGLDVVEMVIAIEQKFRIRIPDETWGRLWTVGQTRDEFVRRMVEAGARDTSTLRAHVWDGIVQIIQQQMRIPPETVKPESRWVPDICRDG
jgi:hypothetical protein